MSINAQLRELESSQLVRQTDEAFRAYIFKHVLVQETAYSSLLKNDRQRLHLQVAECIERSEPDRLDENAARLEQHYAASGDNVRALAYARRAGDYAARMFANTEAIEHYDHAIEILKQHSGTDEEFKSVYLARGRALQESGAFELALENYLALEMLGRDRNDPSLELAGLLERATLHAIPSSVHNPALGGTLNAQALTLAQAQGDRRAECKTLWNLLLIAYFNVEPALAVEYGDRALALARELGWHEMEAYILNDMSRPLISIGPSERVITLLQQARDLFEAQHNLPMLADNLGGSAQTYAFYGAYETSREIEEQAVQLSRTISNPWTLAYSRFSSLALTMSRGELDKMRQLIHEVESLSANQEAIMIMYVTHGWLADIQDLLGNHTGAVNHSRALVAWSKQGYHLGRAWTLGNLTRDLVFSRELEQARETLELAHREKLTDYYSFGPIAVTIGEAELALAVQDGEWALRTADHSIQELRRLGIEFYLPNMYALRGRALLMLNRLDDAAEAFTQASELGERIPARWLLWEMNARWADMEAKRGNIETAQQLRAQASEYVMYIADHCDTPAHRQQFLGQSRVRALFDSIAAAHA